MISAALAVLETEEQRNELSEIYQKYSGCFYSIAMSKLHNKQDAEEAIQEAFLSIAKNPDCFFNITRENRLSYINVIIRNASFRIWNRKNKIRANETELRSDVADKTFSFDEKLCSDLTREEIYDFIDTLPELSKEALYLRIHLQMKYSDIAVELGITEDAVKKRITRAADSIFRFVEEKRNE